mmetsp:Transcript_49515/g.63502  ORF Transcript_49515/g.63502 Transcript_49515/m.63502 type:complete len:442 (-) Transcript_49515:306-1631(-)
MRVAKEERIRKETALEALESALRQRGLLRRPRRGTTGWKAIEQAICWWKGDDSWLDLPRDVQDVDLRTATAWRTYRQKGVGVMSKDVDQELLAVWTESLYYLIANDKDDEPSNSGERSSSRGKATATDPPHNKRRKKQRIDENSQPSGNLKTFNYSNSFDEYDNNSSNNNNNNNNRNSSNNNGWTYEEDDENESSFPLSVQTSSSSFSHTSSNGFNETMPPPNYFNSQNQELPEVKSMFSFPASVSSSSSSSSSSNSRYNEMNQSASADYDLSISPSNSLLNEGFLSSSPLKEGDFLSATGSGGDVRNNRRFVPHGDHYDEMIPTNGESEFDIVCSSIASSVPQASYGHRVSRIEDAGGGIVGDGGGGGRGGGGRGELDMDAERMSEDMANLKLLNEDEAEKYVLDFTTSGLLALGSDLVQCSGLVEFSGEYTNDIAQCLY